MIFSAWERQGKTSSTVRFFPLVQVELTKPTPTSWIKVSCRLVLSWFFSFFSSAITNSKKKFINPTKCPNASFPCWKPYRRQLQGTVEMDFHCSTVDFVFSPYVCAGIVGLQGFTALKPQKVFFHFARDSGSQWCQYSYRPKSVTTCVSFSCGFVEKVYKVTRCSVAFFWRKGSATLSTLPLAKCQHPTEPRPTGLEIFFLILKKKKKNPPQRLHQSHADIFCDRKRKASGNVFFCNNTLNVVFFILLPDKEDRHKRVA